MSRTKAKDDLQVWYSPVQKPFDDAVRALYKGVKQPDGVSPPAVLTYPVKDLQGDFIDPHGLTFKAFKLNPIVNWEHEIPVGRGSVEFKSVSLDGQVWRLPIGTTKFFKSANDTRGLKLNKLDANGNVVGQYSANECVEAAEQAKALVCNRVTQGVSIEFRPIDFHAIGKSLARGPQGQAFRFTAADCLGWAHCVQPVNPGAMQLLDKSFREYDSFHPMIKKSIAAVLKAGKRTMVRGGLDVAVTRSYYQKAGMFSQDIPGTNPITQPQDAPEDDDMPADDQMMPPDGDGGQYQDSPDAGMGGQTLGSDMGMAPDQSATTQHPAAGVRAIYNHVQRLMDDLGMLEQDLQATDNPQLKTDVMNHIAAMKKIAAEVGGYADNTAAKLGPVPGDQMQPDIGDSDPNMMQGSQDMGQDLEGDQGVMPQTAPMPEETEPDTDEQGAYIPKSFPQYRAPRPLKSARRIAKSELRDTPKQEVPQGYELVKATTLKSLIEAVNRLS
jgi:hypothetical protein